MSNLVNIKVPDIGDVDEVEVIEILVSKGETIEKEVGLITLESDKATMEIPAEQEGIVNKIHIKVGDKVKKGTLILDIITNDIDTPKEQNTNKNNVVNDLIVPDIGDFDEVEVIEVLISSGDTIQKEDSLISLESDKASMEIPSLFSGSIVEVLVSVGDKVKQGDVIGKITTQDTANNIATPTNTTNDTPKPQAIPANTIDSKKVVATINNSLPPHASPSVRKLARELGINDLLKIQGLGLKNRILASDLKAFVKNIVSGNGNGSSIPSVPSIDFSQFGEIEVQKLSRINKLSGKHLSACWLSIPHVTQFDEVDITEMNDFRISQKAKGIQLTPLVFIMKALVQTLKKYPRFNSSLDEDNLVLKKYFNLGIAVNTENGLVVPVITDVDKKSLLELAAELKEKSTKAREGKLTTKDLSGGGMTISSLGGIGGTQFTPIVNAPEVAILGVSRSQVKPIWNGENFTPQLMLPLALSYDHRVIDGAQGAQFITKLNNTLSNIREILL